MSGLASRVAVAVPLAAIAIYAVVLGGWPMTVLALVAGLIAIHEFCAMTRTLRPLTVAGFAGVAGVILAVHLGGLSWGVALLVGALVLAFWLSAVADVRQTATVQLAVTLLGVLWIGLGLALLVAIRDIAQPDGWGTTLLFGVLAGVWVNDIAAYVGGRLFGRHKLARQISPNKTVEGFLSGLALGTVATFVVLYDQPGIEGAAGDALMISLAIAIASPIGDLFESYLKRDAQIKDSGQLLGAHGGVLDRVDALLMAGAAAYFTALALDRV